MFGSITGQPFSNFFLDDLNASGQDVPEIRLTVEFAAGAAVDLLIISAGVEGGVRATIDLNLHDGGFFEPIPPENLDGKLRLEEMKGLMLREGGGFPLNEAEWEGYVEWFKSVDKDNKGSLWQSFFSFVNSFARF